MKKSNLKQLQSCSGPALGCLWHPNGMPIGPSSRLVGRFSSCHGLFTIQATFIYDFHTKTEMLCAVSTYRRIGTALRKIIVDILRSRSYISKLR